MNRRDADRAAFEVTQDLDIVNRDGNEANREAGFPFRSIQPTLLKVRRAGERRWPGSSFLVPSPRGQGGSQGAGRGRGLPPRGERCAGDRRLRRKRRPDRSRRADPDVADVLRDGFRENDSPSRLRSSRASPGHFRGRTGSEDVERPVKPLRLPPRSTAPLSSGEHWRLKATAVTSQPIQTG